MKLKKFSKTMAFFLSIALILSVLPMSFIAFANDSAPITYVAPDGNTLSAAISSGVWKYQYAEAKTTSYTDMTQLSLEKGQGINFKDPNYASKDDSARAEQIWGDGTIYLCAGYNDAVLTFVSSKSGKVTIDATTVTRNYGENDPENFSADIAIFKGNTKIWPEGDAWYTLSNANNQKVEIPQIANIEMAEGEELHFAVSLGANAYWKDRIVWKPTVTLTPSKSEAPATSVEYKAPDGNTLSAAISSGAWKYQYAEAKTTSYSDMTQLSLEKGQGINFKDPNYASKYDSARAEQIWGDGTIYLCAGYNDAVLTFVALQGGKVTIDATTVTRNYGENDPENFSADIAIFKGNTKIWPEGDGWYTLSNANGQKAEIPQIANIEMAKGEELHFAVSLGANAYWRDWIVWNPSIKLAAAVETYTITYDANGNGTAPASEKDIPAGQKVKEPTAPQANGYLFGGWYTDKECSADKKWDFDADVVAADITLYAKWTQLKYTVTFDNNGHGTAPEAQANLAYGLKAVAPAELTASGYTFGGWYTDKACSADKKWDFDADVVTADITLYAKWTSNATETPEKPEIPQTGDMGIGFALFALVISALGLSWLGFSRKSKTQKQN